MDLLRWRRKCSEGILRPTVAASDSPWTDSRPDTTQNLSETIEDKLHEALKLARRVMQQEDAVLGTSLPKSQWFSASVAPNWQCMT